jgi:hypothetical protein
MPLAASPSARVDILQAPHDVIFPLVRCRYAGNNRW